MVEVSVNAGRLQLVVKGLDKLWSFKGHLEIPLEHVRAVRADPTIAKAWFVGIRAPGTSIPGIIRAGTFYTDDKCMFWDVHKAENTIVIDLHHEHFDQLVVEVEHPRLAVELITKSITPA